MVSVATSALPLTAAHLLDLTSAHWYLMLSLQEFTKLGSFGTPFQFASNLVNSQDRSYLLKGPKWGRQEEPVQVGGGDFFLIYILYIF